MKSRLATDCLDFPRVTPREAEMVHPRAIRCATYDEDATAVRLAVVGLTLTAAIVLSTLVAFAIF